MLCPQPDARPIIEPQAASLRLFGRNLEPLAPPQTFNTPIAHLPSSISQKSRNATIAVTAILTSQLDHVGNQTIFILSAPRHMPLGGAMLTKHSTGPAFGNTQHVAHLINASSATCGA